MIRKCMDRKMFELDKGNEKVTLGLQLNISSENIGDSSVFSILESVDTEYNRIVARTMQDKT